MSRKYQVSVITPFHNVDLVAFRKGFDSVVHQTIGIQNIEWIIVLHNCEKKYVDGVRAMAAGYDNIRTPILENEAQTPSSPRNYGMSLAQGKLHRLSGRGRQLSGGLPVIT